MSTGQVEAVGRGASVQKRESKGWNRALLVAFALVPVLLLNGCAGLVGGKSQQVSPGSFSVSPSSLNFGKVAAGQKMSQTLTLTNTSSVDVTIQQVSSSNPQFGISGISLPMTVGAGQSTSFSVWINGSSSGNVSGTLTIQGSSGTTTGVVTLAGSITTAQPKLSLNTSSLDFGSVGVGSKEAANLVIGNTGSADLVVSMITLNGADFTISGISTPRTISAGQTVPVVVTFTPAAAGAVSGGLTLTTNDPNTPTSNVILSGTGSTSPLGQLTASPTSLNFPSVAMGSNASQNITLTNTGTVAVKISSAAALGSGFSVSGLATPVTLNQSQSATLSVKFAPTAVGSASGTVTVVSDAGGPPLSIVLSGTGATAPAGRLTAAPGNLSFGNVAAGSSASQNITLTNTGNAALQISSVVAAGTGFSVSGVTPPATLNPSQSATLAVRFAPLVAGNATGTITVGNNVGSPVTITLSGTGTQAGLSVSPASFNYGSVVDGQTKSQNFTLSNTGSAPVTITQISVNGAGYSASGLNTPTTIAVGRSATFSLLFAPTTAGVLGGTVSIASDAPSSPNVVAVSGTGVAASVTISRSPSSISFGSVRSGSSSSKSVTITNSGNASLTISQVNVNAKDVTASGISSGLTLTPGQNAALNLTFNPSASETVTGNVTVMSTQGSSAVIPVTGSGVQAGLTLTPSSVNFGNVTVGSPNSQTIQIANTGTAVLTISQVSVTGSGYSSSSLSLPLSINPGASTNFNVQFAPQSTGTVSGSVSLVSNAPTSPDTASMSGVGVAATATLSLSSTSLSFGNVNAGSSAQQSVTIHNTGNSNVVISQINISGTGYTLSGAGTPVTLSATQRLTITVHFSPLSAGSDSGSVSIVSNATGSPAGITLSGTGVAQTPHSVALNWNASTSSVSGYNVYRSTTSGSGYTKMNSSLVGSLSYTDSTVQSSQTYYYVTTAVDGSGTESGNSNEAQAIIP